VRAVGFRKTHFVWVSLKIDSRTYKTHPDWPAVNCTLVAGEAEDFEEKNDQVEPQPTPGAALQFALLPYSRRPLFFRPLLYPPTDGQGGARTGGLMRGRSGSAKPNLYGFR
jgi:hypothetical protein